MATRNKRSSIAANGKKTRQSPSEKRQIALALVRIIECVVAGNTLRGQLVAGDSSPEYEQAIVDETEAIDEARKVLEANGYGDLESVATRVARIEAEPKKAIEEKKGTRIAELGAALDRAKDGKPPLTVAEKKSRKPRETQKTNNDSKTPAATSGAGLGSPNAGAPLSGVQSTPATGVESNG